MRSSTARRTSAVASALTGTLLLAACSSIGVEENTFESGPLPAVSDDGAADVLEGVDEVLNDANAARDPELLATVVTDPLLAVETARYALDATADPDDETPLPVVEHTDRTVFIPRFVGYPQWFVVASTVVAETPLRIEVLSRESSAAPWTVSMSTDLLPEVEFPELALDEDGYVVPLAPDDLADLPVSIEDLAAQHAEALGGAETTGVATSLAADPWTVARQAADAQRATGVGDAATVTQAYESTGALPEALRTADGGTLVFYALAETVTYQVQPNFFLQLDAATAALVGVAEITTSLTEEWAALLAVYVPADDTGEARVVGARFDRTALAGS